MSGLSELALHADTCGDVMVDALHRDGGVGNGVALQVTNEALDTTVNLKHTHTKRYSIIKGWFKERRENVFFWW